MPVTAIKSKWVDGDLVFTDSAGTEIARFDASAAGFDVDTLLLDGVELTSTAAEINTVATAGTGVASMLAAGLGGANSVLKAETTTKTIVVADAAKDRACLVIAVVDEIIADGTGTAPVITVGEADTLDKLWDGTDFPSGTAAGTVITGAFTNTATKAITVGITAALGNGTGGVSVTVISLPTT